MAIIPAAITSGVGMDGVAVVVVIFGPQTREKLPHELFMALEAADGKANSGTMFRGSSLQCARQVETLEGHWDKLQLSAWLKKH